MSSSLGRVSWVVLFVAALGTTAAQAGDVLYVGTSGNGLSGGLFGTLDQDTAEWTEIGDPTTNGPLPGLARNSLGQFYGTNNATGGSGPSVLIRIDPLTGNNAATIGTVTDSGDDQGVKLTDISFQPGTDVLFGVCGTTGKDGLLYTVDVETAAATLVGDTGLSRGGLAFAADGTLWLGTTGGLIAQLDPADASVIGTPQSMFFGTDALAIRPSDGTFFGHEGDGSAVFTIDPSDGSTVFIGSDTVPTGDVASMVFAPPIPATEVAAYILPRTLKLKLNALEPEKSRLVGAGFFDLGPDAVDLSLGATLDVGDYEVVAPGLVSNKASTVFTLEQAGLQFRVKVAKSGSSRALFRVKLQDDLEGLVDPDGDLAMHFSNLAVDAGGVVALEQGKYKLGKKRGALIEPGIYLFKLRGALKGDGKDGLALKAGMATNGITPDSGPDLMVDLGGGFEATVASEDWVRKGDRFSFHGPKGAITSAVLDYLRETVTVVAKGVDLGAYDEGAQPVDVTLALGGDVRTVSVRMVRKGPSLKY